MPARSHQTLHWKPRIIEHTTPTQTQTRKLLSIYFHVRVTFIGKQDQGSTATSTVHPIIFHSVQVLCNISTAAGTLAQIYIVINNKG